MTCLCCKKLLNDHSNSCSHDTIVGFKPRVDHQVVHHLDAFACKRPAFLDPLDPHVVWNCNNPKDDGVADSPAFAVLKHRDHFICDGEREEESYRMWGWGYSTPAYSLPHEYGWSGQPDHRYLVIQVHYWNGQLLSASAPDSSGLVARIARKDPAKPRKLVGTVSLATRGSVPPRSIVNWDNALRLPNDGVTIHAVSFTVHLHGNGIIGSLWKVDGVTGNWTLIGKSRGHPIEDWVAAAGNVSLTSGDWLASRCVIQNKEDRIVTFGYDTTSKWLNAPADA